MDYYQRIGDCRFCLVPKGLETPGQKARLQVSATPMDVSSRRSLQDGHRFLEDL